MIIGQDSDSLRDFSIAYIKRLGEGVKTDTEDFGHRFDSSVFITDKYNFSLQWSKVLQDFTQQMEI